MEICSKSTGPLIAPFCQGEVGKVITIRTWKDSYWSSLYSQKVRKSGAGFLTSSNSPRLSPGTSQKTHSALYELDGIHYFLAHIAGVTYSYCGVKSLSVSGLKDLGIIISYYCNTWNFKNINIQKTEMGLQWKSSTNETAISSRSVTVKYNSLCWNKIDS